MCIWLLLYYYNIIVIILVIIIRPHGNMHVDAAYCYRPNSAVCLFVCHSHEPCRNSWTDWETIWFLVSDGLKEPWIRWRSRLSDMKWQFLRERSCPCVPDVQNGWTERDAIWFIQDSDGLKGACVTWGCTLAPPDLYDCIVRVWRRCNLFVKLLWPLVIIVVTYFIW